MRSWSSTQGSFSDYNRELEELRSILMGKRHSLYEQEVLPVLVGYEEKIKLSIEHWMRDILPSAELAQRLYNTATDRRDSLIRATLVTSMFAAFTSISESIVEAEVNHDPIKAGLAGSLAIVISCASAKTLKCLQSRKKKITLEFIGRLLDMPHFPLSNVWSSLPQDIQNDVKRNMQGRSEVSVPYHLKDELQDQMHYLIKQLIFACADLWQRKLTSLASCDLEDREALLSCLQEHRFDVSLTASSLCRRMQSLSFSRFLNEMMSLDIGHSLLHAASSEACEGRKKTLYKLFLADFLVALEESGQKVVVDLDDYLSKLSHGVSLDDNYEPSTRDLLKARCHAKGAKFAHDFLNLYKNQLSLSSEDPADPQTLGALYV